MQQEYLFSGKKLSEKEGIDSTGGEPLLSHKPKELQHLQAISNDFFKSFQQMTFACAKAAITASALSGGLQA
ncbi:MAG TPA: hypothetical protein VNO70_01460 [Blastocatellia bacterium]|nr:hypothetical protein [Blastocatellia bacterium]